MAKLTFRAFVGIIAAVVVEVAAAQTVHIVGDNMGWDVPSAGAGAYTTWASSKHFVVGDILTFDFQTNNHDVQRVTTESFDTCTSSNPIGDLILTGPANVTLNSTGDHYFICTIGRHCLAGQKLSITVDTAGPTASPQPPPRSHGPASPTAQSPADCSPTPTPQPTGATAGGTITDPPSSSSVIVASSLISMLSIVVGMIF